MRLRQHLPFIYSNSIETTKQSTASTQNEIVFVKRRLRSLNAWAGSYLHSLEIFESRRVFLKRLSGISSMPSRSMLRTKRMDKKEQTKTKPSHVAHMTHTWTLEGIFTSHIHFDYIHNAISFSPMFYLLIFKLEARAEWFGTKFYFG